VVLLVQATFFFFIETNTKYPGSYAVQAVTDQGVMI